MTQGRIVYLVVCLLGYAYAQQFRGSISGIVSDPSGATVPSAAVTATEASTGTRYRSVSTNDGRYTLPQLLPGTYRVEVEAKGFKKLSRAGVTVSSEQQVGLNLTLQVGAVTETIDVTENAAMLDTEDASLGQTVNIHDVDNLPLNGRTPIMFAQLSPGVSMTTNITATTPFDNGQAASWAMGGSVADQNALLLDGNDNTQPEVGQLAHSLPMLCNRSSFIPTMSIAPWDGRAAARSMSSRGAAPILSMVRHTSSTKCLPWRRMTG